MRFFLKTTHLFQTQKLGGVIGVRLIVTIGIIELIFQVEMELIHHMKNMHARYAMLRCLLPIKLHHDEGIPRSRICLLLMGGLTNYSGFDIVCLGFGGFCGLFGGIMYYYQRKWYAWVSCQNKKSPEDLILEAKEFESKGE